MKRILVILIALLLCSVSAASAETLSVLANGDIQAFFEGEDVHNNDIYHWLCEKSGLELNYSILPMEGGAEKRNLIMASGEAPDLVILDRGAFLSYIQQGLLQPLDEAIANSEVFKDTLSAQPEIAQMGMIDGITYAVCTPNNGAIQPTDFLVNEPVLTAAGVTIPEIFTPESFATLLREIKEKCPEYIPFAASGGRTASYKLYGFEWLYAAYGLSTEFRVDKDNNLEFSANTEDMRECLALIAELNKEGLIDPEYSVTKTEKIIEKYVDGRVATMGLGWYENANPPTLMYNEDGSQIWKWLGNAGGRENSTGQNAGAPASRYLCVPFNSKKVQEAVDYASLLCTDEAYLYLMYGEEGVDYIVNDNGIIENLPESRRIIEGQKYFVYYYVSESLEGRTQRVWAADEGMPWFQEWEYHCGVDLKDVIDPAAYMPVIDEYVDVIADLRTLASEYFMKIATGALEIDAFDEYLEKFDEYGGAEMLEAVNAWYDTL